MTSDRGFSKVVPQNIILTLDDVKSHLPLKDWFIRQRQLRNMFGQATALTNVFQSRQVSA
jgi:hypothetical protein